ncbi:oxidoreductase [Bombiscardovia apis]|uniref:Oxidoreductase n=1 Tax=Bombiscardovia apis TaxID=2932182 RepID=A0ABM8BAH3_9BIFI|nr:NAD(P)H-binding protein [Bombiscardovia apis]BDR53918.1 oxidoreductase [Bombiscardovia apis]
MRVIVVGASGRVGKATIEQLTKRGHTVVACARHFDQVKTSGQVEAEGFDMTGDLNAMTATFLQAQAQAVVFTAGSRGADVIHVDALGAIKTMEAAQGAGIKRYVLLGALYAADLERWDEPGVKKVIDQLPDYYPAKYFADDHLMHSGLDYTIVEPGALVETAGRGSVATDPEQAGPIAIEDVAEMLAASLDEPASVGRVYRIIHGDTPIEQALQ